MNIDLSTDEIETIKFILGVYNTKNEIEEINTSSLYKKFCNLSDMV